jgi:hypothetical protein
MDMMRHGGWQAPSHHPQQAPAASGPAAAAADDPIAQLRALAALRQRGDLTDAEFSAQKSRILEGR